MQPVYDGAKKLAGAVFGIFAADDTLLADGNDGADIYDTETDEKIVIPVLKSTHEANSAEEVKGLLEKYITLMCTKPEVLTTAAELSFGICWSVRHQRAM